MEYFNDKKNQLLEWPAVSPNLNPIEKAWSMLFSEVYANGTQYSTTHELDNAVDCCWNRLDQNVIKKIILTMKKNVFPS